MVQVTLRHSIVAHDGWKMAIILSLHRQRKVHALKNAGKMDVPVCLAHSSRAPVVKLCFECLM